MKTAFNGSGGGGGVQWRRQRSTVTAVGATDIGDDKAMMEIDISGGG